MVKKLTKASQDKSTASQTQSQPQQSQKSSKIKHPRNAYNLYVIEETRRVRAENKGLAHREAFKIAASNWRKMTLAAREKYVKAATKDRERYQNEKSGMASGAHLTSELKLVVKQKGKSVPKLSAPEPPKINKQASKSQEKKTVSEKKLPPKTQKSNLTKPAVQYKLCFEKPEDQPAARKLQKSTVVEEKLKPRRYMVPFMCYVKENAKKLIIDQKLASAAPAISILGKRWREMSDKQKKTYVDLSQVDQKRYEAQCREQNEKGFFTLQDGTTSQNLKPKLKKFERVSPKVLAVDKNQSRLKIKILPKTPKKKPSKKEESQEESDIFNEGGKKFTLDGQIEPSDSCSNF